MTMPRTQRKKITFSSVDSHCAAWHYPGDNGVAPPGPAR
jgi:hypothetical protein